MTPTQEMVMTLFTKETIDKVKEQFKNGKEVISNDNFNMDFRLFKTTANTINLELLLFLKPTEIGEEQNFPGIGLGKMGRMTMVFKPIGYFTQSNNLNSHDLEITILKEFEEDLDVLIKTGKIQTNIKINKLNLKANALIAAFSIEASIEAEKQKDVSFISNGLNCDIYLTHWGKYPQVFLNDKYGLEGPIAAYLNKDGQKSANPIIEYQELFNKLLSMSLLSVFKTL